MSAVLSAHAQKAGETFEKHNHWPTAERPIVLTAHIERQEDGECIVGTSVNVLSNHFVRHNSKHVQLETRFAHSCGTNWRLAERLVEAINAGHVLADPRVVKDNGGHEYVIATFKINPIHMSAELRRLGF